MDPIEKDSLIYFLKLFFKILYFFLEQASLELLTVFLIIYFYLMNRIIMDRFGPMIFLGGNISIRIYILLILLTTRIVESAMSKLGHHYVQFCL